jgi:hypothetical protein
MATGRAPVGHAQQRGQLGGIEDRHPAQADALGPRRQPHVLDGTGHRGQVHLGQGAAAEDVLLAPVGQGHHDHLAGLQQAFHLEAHEVFLALPQGPGGGAAFHLDQGVHALAQAPVGDADEAPGLHVAHAGGVVGGPQKPRQQRRIDRIRAEVAHVAPLGDHAVDGGHIGIGKAVGAGVGGGIDHDQSAG